MLPPAPEQGVLMPSFTNSKTPDVEAIQQEQMRRVEEMEKAKGEGAESQALKMKHIDEMLKALDEGGEDAFFGTMKADDAVILPPADFEDEETTAIPKHSPAPKIKEPTEKEMEEWEKWLANMRLSNDTMKDIPQTGGTSDEEEGTIRPGARHASLDSLLKKCDFYYGLTISK